MRIWSVHPQYLDAKGLVALWRETLLAKHVLEGRTKGYRNHPQLTRFRAAARPDACISQYLSVVLEEAGRRGYRFDRSKINWDFDPVSLPLTTGQLDYETAHLMRKLELREPARAEEVRALLQGGQSLRPHPMFYLQAGPVAEWEIIS